MAYTDAPHVFGLFVFPLIALFYLLRLARGRAWMGRFDVESEVGHALMALGMVCMLAPSVLFIPQILFWNVLLFAVASLWFIGRLVLQRPLLSGILLMSVPFSTFQADAIHVLMSAGMCYMFLLMSNMALSMFPLALPVTSGFGLIFLLLSFFYSRESIKDVQAPGKNWLQCGANLAHTLMCVGMLWMFLNMISMNMNMR